MIEVRAKLNGQKSAAGYLIFNEVGVEFHEDFKFGANEPIEILSEDIIRVEIGSSTGQDNLRTFGRAFFFGWKWAMLFPKFQTKSMIEIELSNGQLFFFETDQEEMSLRQILNPIISKWFN